MKTNFSYSLIFFVFVLSPLFLMAQTAVDTVAAPLSLTTKTSLFNHLYEMEGNVPLGISTNIKQLIRDKMAEVYQEADIRLPGKDENVLLELPARIKTRGNMRKKVSYLPPVKIDFGKSALDSCGFLKMDDLKIVFPAGSDRRYQQLLYKEFLCYEIYALIDSNYMRTKLVDISISWEEKERFAFTGFLIEEKKEYARRKNLNVIEKGKLVAEVMDRSCFLKMLFFQFMIANTDWAVDARHNFEMVKLPNVKRPVAMPYDFDYAGFVGQHYAVPDPRLGIESVQERFFYPHYKMTETEFEEMVTYYLSIEKDVYTVCKNASYMEDKTRAKSLDFLKSFFDALRERDAVRELMVKVE